MRLIAFAAALLLAVASAAAKDWKEYSYPDYLFSVWFPAPPMVESTTYQAADGRSVEARVYSVPLGDAVLRMSVVDLAGATMEQGAVIRHAIKMLSERGEIKINILTRIARVFGRQLNIVGADGSRSSVEIFYYKGRLYQIEGDMPASAEDASADVIRFEQSLVFTDKANASWPQLVERFRGDCLRQFQYLRGPGQAENVREHVRNCIVAKVQAEAGKAAREQAGGPGPETGATR